MEEKTTYREIKDPYGFIYVTTNLVNGRRYLGQRVFDVDGYWKYYLGSGVVLKKAIEKYGKENFHRDIVCICYSSEELNNVEYELSVFLNVVESENYYNLVYGGKVLHGENNPMYNVSPKERMDEKTYEQWLKKITYNSTGENNVMFGKHHSEETKKKIREKLTGNMVGSKNPFYGKHHSEETKEKLRQINTGKKASDKTKKIFSEQRAGKNNPKAHPLYCYELQKFFWGAKDVKDQYPTIPANLINQVCGKENRSCGKHPDTGEKLHWKYATKEEYEKYIKEKENDK